MSLENVELHRRAFEALKDRDLDGLLAVLDDEVEAFPMLAGMEGVFRGHDGVRRWWADLLTTFPDFDAEIVDVDDLGDLTIAEMRFKGHGAGSDTPLDAVAWQVARFREGKCTGWRVYTRKVEALEAAGLQDLGPRSSLAQGSEGRFAE